MIYGMYRMMYGTYRMYDVRYIPLQRRTQFLILNTSSGLFVSVSPLAKMVMGAFYLEGIPLQVSQFMSAADTA